MHLHVNTHPVNAQNALVLMLNQAALKAVEKKTAPLQLLSPGWDGKSAGCQQERQTSTCCSVKPWVYCFWVRRKALSHLCMTGSSWMPKGTIYSLRDFALESHSKRKRSTANESWSSSPIERHNMSSRPVPCWRSCCFPPAAVRTPSALGGSW